MDDLGEFVQEMERTRPGVKAVREDPHAVQGILDALVARRKELGLTQQQVADHLNITQASVSEFESESADPKISTLQRYARAVGTKIEFELPPTEEPAAEHQCDGENDWCDKCEAKERQAEQPAEPKPRFQCRCGHPGMGCDCHGKWWNQPEGDR